MTEKIYIKDLIEGQEVESIFLLSEARLAQTKTGSPFLTLILTDKSGQIEAKIWDKVEELSKKFLAGQVLKLVATVSSYQGNLQLKIQKGEILDEGTFNWGDILAASSHSVSEMLEGLKKSLKKITDPDLRGLCLDLLADQDFQRAFSQSSAAKNFHHSYLGGLLEHTLALVKAAESWANLYPSLNKDLLVAGAFWHDLGKMEEFSPFPENDYTTPGRLLGHIMLGVELLNQRLLLYPYFPQGLALLLKHLIISHHGELEFGSPQKPQFIEAFILHHLDNMDAKINSITKFIEEKANAQSGWTDYHRLLSQHFYDINKSLNPENSAVKPPQIKNSKKELKEQPSLF